MKLDPLPHFFPRDRTIGFSDAIFAVVITLLVLALALGAAGCSSNDQSEPTVDPLEAYCPIDAAEVDARIDAILGTLSLRQKAALMHGTILLPVNGTWETAAFPEKGIPGFHMLDGPKGVGGSGTLDSVLQVKTTAFPVPIARAATWDRDLETRVGEAIAQELRAVGGDVLLAPGLNLAWHPLSGRNQEYYGEDPFLSGEIGVAFVRGVQAGGVIATAKHFTANHVEDNRLEFDAIMDERTLRESFLPQFRKVVRQGAVGSVMSAYNKVNGTYCGENETLLGDILKDEWDFSGYVVSDFVWGAYNTVPSATAGLDLEMPIGMVYGDPVVEAVDSGELDEANVDDHVRRTLRAQLCYELDTNPPTRDESQLETPETLALAREVSEKSSTLLRNEGGFLPLSKTATQSIVLVGPLADLENIGDTKGSSGVRSNEIVTIAEGLLARDDIASTIEILSGDLTDEDDRTKVAQADVVIVAVGLTEDDEGEGQVRPPAPELGAGDRETYGLTTDQESFVASVLELTDNAVVVLEGGSAIDVSPWFDETRAVLMAWYPGVQGGNAIANLLFGDANPSGRLPVSFPASLDDLQPFPSDEVEAQYERYHGYQRLDRNQVSPLLPFGFGLSYTTFEYSNLSARQERENGVDLIRLSFTVTNTGTRDGVETAQVYGGIVDSDVERPVRKLVGFAQTNLAAGESETVEVVVPVRELAYFEPGTGWTIEPGTHRLEVGPNVADRPLETTVEL